VHPLSFPRIPERFTVRDDVATLQDNDAFVNENEQATLRGLKPNWKGYCDGRSNIVKMQRARLSTRDLAREH